VENIPTDPQVIQRDVEETTAYRSGKLRVEREQSQDDLLPRVPMVAPPIKKVRRGKSSQCDGAHHNRRMHILPDNEYR
jgi:hypothetical protein